MGRQDREDRGHHSVAVSDGDLASGRTHALEVLRRSAAKDVGFVASADDAHYTSLWARDAAYSAFGANVSADPALVGAVRDSLLTLAKLQARNGQIPDAYWPARDYWDFGEAGCTDATSLFIVAAHQHLAGQPDDSLRAHLWPHLTAAFTWLTYQDQNQFGLIDSVEAGDWMDSTLCRSGKVFYNNVVYYAAAKGLAELALDTHERAQYAAAATTLRDKINFFFWPQPGANYADILGRGSGLDFPHPASQTAYAGAAKEDRRHYISHVQWGRFVDECDTLAHVLAVLFDIPDGRRARTVMEHLYSDGAAQPYPLRTYSRSFAADDRWGMYKAVADPLQGERWRNPPGTYHNGAVWPFIGGLYVAALVHVGMRDEARAEMERLMAANSLNSDGSGWGFHEWINATTGEPGGPTGQTWSAGTFVFAADALEKGAGL